MNFMIWNFVWTVLALLYLSLAPTYFPNAHNKWVVTAVEAITMIFWFCGWIALASWVGNLSVCFGTVCGCARGAVVFAVFEWIAWCASFGIVVRAIMAWNAQHQDSEAGGAVPYYSEPKHPAYPPSPGGAEIYEANPSTPDIYVAQPDSPPPAAGNRMPSGRHYRSH